MKKILIILLALACTFTMFSCGDSVDGFNKAIKNTNPAVVNVVVESETSLGLLKANYETTYAEDGSFTIKYSYEKFNGIAEGDADDVIAIVSGTVTCDKDGNYSDGGALVGAATTVTGTKIKLGKKMDYSVSRDGNVLTATIKAAKTKSVFGAEFPADVTLVITKAEGKIVSYTIRYTTDAGTTNIICEYK